MGMNRIRAGYLELAPDLERFFVMGVHNDVPGMLKTMAFQPKSKTRSSSPSPRRRRSWA
jgi:hypothetical protein